MSNKFVTFLKKLGAIVSWPVSHAVMMTEILATAYKDEPEVKTVVVGIVKQFEGISADVVAAVAGGGVNITADMKGFSDIVAFFQYMKSTALPTIESVYTQLKTDAGDGAADPASPAPATAAGTAASSPAPASAPAASTDAASAADQPQPGPGLHTVVAG